MKFVSRDYQLAMARNFLDFDDTPSIKRKFLFDDDSEKSETDKDAVIFPRPIFCLKSQDKNRNKIFINFCISDVIPEPPIMNEYEINNLAGKGFRYCIPAKMGLLRDELDNDGEGFPKPLNVSRVPPKLIEDITDKVMDKKSAKHDIFIDITWRFVQLDSTHIIMIFKFADPEDLKDNIKLFISDKCLKMTHKNRNGVLSNFLLVLPFLVDVSKSSTTFDRSSNELKINFELSHMKSSEPLNSITSS
ncbi:PIH1 domain-containing protein 1 [Thelohanellus kitauei]|uniref:PIH1 domain-containing protein 1 n=1 Tax=Thelohanellus kitauei TaxID=669202 RepID=A0A0C2M3E7_THEKT|nr:PIH1 domain-containing protein 1 [Thelohanellus kitauei]